MPISNQHSYGWNQPRAAGKSYDDLVALIEHWLNPGTTGVLCNIDPEEYVADLAMLLTRNRDSRAESLSQLSITYYNGRWKVDFGKGFNSFVYKDDARRALLNEVKRLLATTAKIAPPSPPPAPPEPPAPAPLPSKEVHRRSIILPEG